MPENPSEIKEDVKILRTFESPHIFLALREDGILWGKWRDGIFIDLDIAIQVVHQRKEFQQGAAYPAVIDARGIRGATKEARAYLAKQGAEMLSAGALLIGSPLTRALGNIFIYINKPAIPTKLFTSEEEAVKWAIEAASQKVENRN